MITRPSSPLLVAILGPTASGKTAVAEALAKRFGLQLINADAFMVYRGLDIGTNKPANKQDYELLDIVEPHQEFGVGEYVRRASDLLWQIYRNPPLPASWGEGKGEGPDSKSPPSPLRGGGARGEGSDDQSPFHIAPPGAIVVGGTGLYVRALFEQYQDLMPAPDPALRAEIERRERTEGLQALARELAEKAPEIARQTDLSNPVRVRRALERLADPRPPIQFSLPPFRKLKYVLDPPQHDLDQAIAARVERMFAQGWVQEVQDLLAQGVEKSSPAFRAIGYDSVIGLIEGSMTEEEAKSRIATETRQYAKRQRTWLRSEPNATTLDQQQLADLLG